jgi:hypothetical protein
MNHRHKVLDLNYPSLDGKEGWLGPGASLETLISVTVGN